MPPDRTTSSLKSGLRAGSSKGFRKQRANPGSTISPSLPLAGPSSMSSDWPMDDSQYDSPLAFMPNAGSGSLPSAQRPQEATVGRTRSSSTKWPPLFAHEHLPSERPPAPGSRDSNTESTSLGTTHSSWTGPTSVNLPRLEELGYPLHDEQRGVVNPGPSPSTSSKANADRWTVPPRRSGRLLGLAPDPTPIPSTATHSTDSGLFAHSRDFSVDNFECNIYNNMPKRAISKGWDTLGTFVAPNALFNAKARFDPPKCDEGTRIALTDKIMDWIQDHQDPQRLLYMTGAAGAGKSAIQQTIAEQCAERGILAASFFFSTGDATRNTTSRVITTMAYQLGQKATALRRMIGDAVENDSTLLEQSLISQMQALILDPMSRLSPSDLSELPHAVLVDGLDECNDEGGQREFLRVLGHCTKERTHLRFFVASRPEMVIADALEPPHGHLHKAAYQIWLSDDTQYDASDDIRRTVARKLRELGEQRKLPYTWFTEEDVEHIVKAASGQYIYAITALGYVSEPRASPVRRLNAILKWKAGEKQSNASPFASLDTLYANILSNAKQEYDKVLENQEDFLRVFYSYCIDYPSGFTLAEYDLLLELEEGTFERIILDLRSLVTVNDGSCNWDNYGSLKIYHKSFRDFLFDRNRAHLLYAETRALKYTISCCLRRVEEVPAEKQSTWSNSTATSTRDYTDCVLYHLSLCVFSFCKISRPADLTDSFIRFSDNGGFGWDVIDKWLCRGFEAIPEGMLHFSLHRWLPTFPLVLSVIKNRDPGTWATMHYYWDRWTGLKIQDDELKRRRIHEVEL